MDLPVATPEQTQTCIVQAANFYGAHPDLVRAIALTENGKPGKIHWNSDGSFDIGRMQVNSINLKDPQLIKHGITKEKLLQDDCLNIHVGTYLLQQQLLGARTPIEFWNGVGRYNSKTPDKNIKYQYRVWGNLQRVQESGR